MFIQEQETFLAYYPDPPQNEKAYSGFRTTKKGIPGLIEKNILIRREEDQNDYRG